MRRRTVLASIGVATVGSLAGCSSDCLAPDDARTDTGVAWEQVGRDPANTGRAASDGPTDPTVTDWELWEYAESDAEREGFATPPVLADGRAFVATGLASRYAEAPPGRLFALEAGTDTPVWSASVPAGVSGAPAVVGDAVAVPTRDGSLVAFDRGDGEKRWTVSVGTAPGTPTVAGDHLYVGDDAGHLNVVDPAAAERCARHSLVPTGARLLNRPRPAMAPPAVVDGTAYVTLDTGTDQHGERPGTLVAVNLNSGDVAWRYEEPTSVKPCGPAVGADTVYVSLGSAVHAVDRSDGTRRWRFATGFDRPSRPTLDGTTLYVSAKNVYALDAERGTEQWRMVNRSERGYDSDTHPRQDAPAVAGDVVYVGLGALDAGTGERLWGAFGDGDSERFGELSRAGNVAPEGPAVGDGAFVATVRHGRVVMAR